MEDALTIVTGGLGGGDAALLAAGTAAIALGAVQWGVPYLKKFFKKVAS